MLKPSDMYICLFILVVTLVMTLLVGLVLRLLGVLVPLNGSDAFVLYSIITVLSFAVASYIVVFKTKTTFE